MRLRQIIESNSEWQDPDTYFNESGATTIIYTADGNMYYGGKIPHGVFISINVDLFRRYDAMGLLNNAFKNVFGTPQDQSSEYAKRYAKQEIGEAINQWFRLKRTPQLADTVGGGSNATTQQACNECGGTGANYGTNGFKFCYRCVSAWRKLIGQVDLLGRVNPGHDVVSFWNDKPEVYTKLLRPCIDKLLLDHYLRPNGQISTPTHGTISIADLDATKPEALTPEQQKDVQLRQQLHTLPAAQKKVAMQKLGLLDNNFHANDWQQAGMKAGLLKPGQKWWAPASESLNKRSR